MGLDAVSRIMDVYCGTVGARSGLWDKKLSKPRSPIPAKSRGIYETNKKIVDQYINGGWEPEVLIGYIEAAYESKTTEVWLSAIFPKGAVNKETNILLGNELHPEVFNMPPVPRLKALPNGEYVRVNTSGNITKKTEYTIENLACYYKRRLKFNLMAQRDIPGFKWLLDEYGLDLILYSIDQVFYLIRDGVEIEFRRGPLDLQNYFKEGAELLKRRKMLGALI